MSRVRNRTPKPTPAPRVSPEAAHALLAALAAAVPTPRCELNWETPFELLIGVQLSAQCLDTTVNKVTPALFAAYPTPEAMKDAPLEHLEQLLRPTGMFRVKAAHAKESARILHERHGGEVPADVTALQALPGVAKKSANVVMGTAFGVASGITVDTHMFRVTRRWGWHAEKTPEKTEAVLQQLVPQEEWIDFSHRGVLFGRYTCTAKAPACVRAAASVTGGPGEGEGGAEGPTCPLAALCPSFGDPGKNLSP